MNFIRQKALSYLIIVLIPTTLILTNLLTLTFDRNFYHFVYQKEKIYENFENPNIAISSTDNLLAYFRGKKELEDNFFSIRARLHLSDVKSLIILARDINFFAITTMLISVTILGLEKKGVEIRTYLKKGFLLTFIICIIATFMAFLNFPLFFEKFHLVLFSNNLWTFDPTDNLIKLFPISFFIIFFLRLILQTLFFTILFFSFILLFEKNAKARI